MTAETAFAGETKPIPWWLVLLEGIAAVIIGILLLLKPGMTTLALVQIIGIYWFISGIFAIVSIFIDSAAWGWKLFSGILGIIAGIVIIQHPLWSTALVPATVVIILGIEGILIGGINIFRAFKGAGWGTGILGAMSIVFGIILLMNPAESAVALVIVLGLLGIAGGVVAILTAFRLK